MFHSEENVFIWPPPQATLIKQNCSGYGEGRQRKVKQDSEAAMFRANPKLLHCFCVS